MSKSKEPAPHPCWAKVNEALAPRNAQLEMAMTINIANGTTGSALYIPLRKVNARQRSSLTKLAPIYCPFCGEKL